MRALRVALPSLGGLALAAVLVWLARDLDAAAREGHLGPGFWPRLVLGGLGLACLARAAETWRRARRSPPAPAATGPGGPIARGRLVAVIGLIVLYVVATPWLGFALATALFVAAFVVVSGMRSPAGVAANVIVGTVGLLYVFLKLVYLPLPKGAGPVESVTLALYRALGIF
jgi:hypothetical protein